MRSKYTRAKIKMMLAAIAIMAVGLVWLETSESHMVPIAAIVLLTVLLMKQIKDFVDVCEERDELRRQQDEEDDLLR